MTNTTTNNTDTDTDIKITLPPDLPASTLSKFKPYQDWRSQLTKSLALQTKQPNHPFHKDPYRLQSITIQTCDYFSKNRLGFIKLQADIRNSKSETLPGSVFLRGGSVAILIILQPHSSSSSSSEGEEEEEEEEEEHVVLTTQPRIPAASLSFTELPAGMIDDAGTFAGAAAKEIQEETGLEIHGDELLDMTALAVSSGTSSSSDGEEHEEEEMCLRDAVYPSPGGCDEFIPIYLVRRKMEKTEIQALKGRLTGLREHGEKITLRICKLSELWRVAARDAKALAALALYDGLTREGLLAGK